MPTLSVVMIVKDEADCLADCLESVRAVADEFVVADTGSSDGTMAIARDFGARVVSVPWEDDFAEARNQALAAATGDWLLHLDADEVVDPGGARCIREIVDADGGGADAIEVTLANYCDDARSWRWTPVSPGDPLARGHAGYIAVGLLRLFRNGMGFEYREPVHENITESVLERGGTIRQEPIIIHHYGYSVPDEAKAARYLAIGRRKAEQRPDDPKAWHDLAEQLLACGRADEAEEACRRALAIDATHLGAATALANMLLNRGELDAARVLFERLEDEGIHPPHIVMTLGAIAYRQGRLDEARQRLEAVTRQAPASIMAHLYLARVLDVLHEPDAARVCIEQAIAIAPGLDEAVDRLAAHRLRTEGERLFGNNAPRDALGKLVEALRVDPEDPVTQNDLGVVLAALGEQDQARECFNRALALVPGMADAVNNADALG
jgi:Flp pilus assembly protein TadD